MTQIDQDAFADCGGLEEITFNGDAPEIADSIFDYVSADVWVFGIADSWTPENRPDLGGTLTWHYFEDTWTQRLTLPNNLKLIEDQAFQNTVAKMVILPDGVSYIGSKAFGDSEELCAVLLPEGNINIAADAFEGSEVIIFAPAGSAAEAFAEAHGIDFFASEWQNRLDSIQQ